MLVTRWLKLATALTLLSAAPASSQEAETTHLWDERGWNLYIDHTLDDGCFIIKANVAMAFRFQQDPINSRIMVFLSSPRWQSLEEDKTYPLYFQIDSFPAWDVNATASYLGTMPTLRFEVDDTNFVDELLKGHTMRFSTNGKPMGDVDLAGSGKAITMLAGCMTERDKLKDPFSGQKSPIPPPVFVPAPKAKEPDPFST